MDVYWECDSQFSLVVCVLYIRAWEIALRHADSQVAWNR